MRPPSAESDAGPADKDKPAKPTTTEPATTEPATAKPATSEPAEVAKTGANVSSATSAKAAGSADTSSIMVRIVPGITRYHKEDCLLIRFLAEDDLEVMSLKSAAGEGYVACKACKPDQTTAATT